MFKPFASILCAALILPAALFAQSGNWASYRDTSWQYSTAANATNYINTAAELAQFAWRVNSGTTFNKTVNIITGNIDLAAHYWTPAGNNSLQFTGTLTSESGVLINSLKINTSYDYAGLLGYIGSGGNVSSITLTNTTISAGAYVGGIAGFNSAGIITNCANYGTVSSSSSTSPRSGGIVGHNTGTIKNCMNYGAVSASSSSSSTSTSTTYASYAGGITGYSSVTINDCVNYGNISATTTASSYASSYAGGIVGYILTSTSNCVNHGAVSASASRSISTSTLSTSNAGGIAGYMGSGTVDNCVNHGKISSSSPTTSTSYYIDTYAGGIVGNKGIGTIRNCVNHGAVSSTSSTTSSSIYIYAYAGGIAGYAASGTIINCVNHGAVSSSSSSSSSSSTYARAYAGGIAGYASSGTIANCVNHGAVSSSTTSSSGGIAGYASSGTIANCVSHGAVSSSTTSSSGGIVGSNASGNTIRNCYWNPDTTRRSSATGSNSGTVVNCASFGAGPNTLSTTIYGTTSLYEALNAYVVENPTLNAIELSPWMIERSADGYPYLAIFPLPPEQYTVTFDLGGHGARTGGGELEQSVEEGGAAIAPMVAGNDGWTFGGWDAAFDSVESNMLVNAVYVNFAMALDAEASGLVWTSGGGAAWVPQLAGGYENGACAASGAIGDSEQSWMETTVAGPGTLSFMWRVSCEDRNDSLQLIVDGVEETRLTGESGWEQHSIRFDDETPSTVRWSYVKSRSGAGGEDKAWLDNVLWLPDLPDLPDPPLTFAEALDTENLAWTTRGDAEWGTAKNGALDGGGCASSGNIGDEETSTLETTVTGPGTLSFLWRVSCEANLDSLQFFVDGVEQTRISGETGWEQYSVRIEDETPSTASWSYVKGRSGAGGEDKAWLDKVQWLPDPAMPLEEALDTEKLAWLTYGEAQWRGIKTGAFDGVDCARSGEIGDNEASALETTVTGPGTISFKWRTSCEEAYDNMAFRINNTHKALITGETAWRTLSFEIGSGTHTLVWEYWKDEMMSEGDDCGYLDQVSWILTTTKTTPIPVPHAWLDKHWTVVAGNYEAAATAPAANGMAVWECYLAGLDPTDATAKFVATIKVENGQVVIGQDPDMGDARIYEIFGKETLDGAWSFPTNSESRFFKVKVRMRE